MQYVSLIKSMVLGKSGKLGLLLIAAVAGGLFLFTKTDESAQAVVCAGAPQQAQLNVYPVTFQSPAEFCHDYAPIDARLATDSGQYSQNQQDYNDGLTAHDGDQVYILSYIHNGAVNVGVPDSQTLAKNVAISTSVPTSTGTDHVISTHFAGSNTNTVNGSFTIHTAPDEHLEVVAGSGQMRNFTATQVLQSGFDMGSGQSFSIGDQHACFEFSVFVRFTVKVVKNPTNSQTVLRIVKEVRDLTATANPNFAHSTNASNGDTVEYRIQITNIGQATAKNVIATDTMASGLAYVDGSLQVSVNHSGQLTGGGMTLGDLGTGQTITITYKATVNQSSGTITNTATAKADNAALVQDQAIVIINGSPNAPICTPVNQTVDIDETASFHASGGNGSFSWSAPSGHPSSGNGSNFDTFYNNDGNYTVTVTSNGLSDTCDVKVRNDNNNDNVVCTPSSQTVDIDERADFDASGGNGSFHWSAPDGSPSSGNGDNFSTRYDQEGTFTVRVTSNGDSDTCDVRVREDDNNNDRELRIRKLVRNITSGSSSFQNSVSAKNGDRVEYQLTITNTGDSTVSNVVWDDDLPNGITLTNSSNDGGSLGSISRNDSETVTFQANVNSNASSGTCLVNTAGVRGSGVSRVTDSASVCVSSVLGQNVNLQLSKRARNDTQNVSDATTTTANRGDLITYTLVVTNTGNSSANNFVITDDLSGVLAFADIVDTGGGTVNGNVISYPAVTVPSGGGTVSKTFQVRVKPSLQTNLTFVLRNTYGNTVNINVGGVQGASIFVAPTTGAAGTSAAVFAGLITAGFLAFRKRQWLKKLILA